MSSLLIDDPMNNQISNSDRVRIPPSVEWGAKRLHFEPSYILILKFEKQSKTTQLVPWASSSSISE